MLISFFFFIFLFLFLLPDDSAFLLLLLQLDINAVVMEEVTQKRLEQELSRNLIPALIIDQHCVPIPAVVIAGSGGISATAVSVSTMTPTTSMMATEASPSEHLPASTLLSLEQQPISGTIVLPAHQTLAFSSSSYFSSSSSSYSSSLLHSSVAKTYNICTHCDHLGSGKCMCPPLRYSPPSIMGMRQTVLSEALTLDETKAK